MNQKWFEMLEIRRRTFNKSVWIPFRASKIVEEIGHKGHAGYKEDYFGAGSIMITVEQKTIAGKLGWMDIGINNDHKGYIQNEEYIPVNIYKDGVNELMGEYLVLEQRFSGNEKAEWHLNQDFVITLGLKREKDVWIRPDEDYIEIAKLHRWEDGSPCLLEVRSSHLCDYLCARKMTLLITSYHQRVEIVENVDSISWKGGVKTEKNEIDQWEGRITEIHEGGMLFGSEVSVLHLERTDVDGDEDVPKFDFPTDDVVKSESWTSGHHGKKLFRIQGELWRKEWIDPATLSPLVRRDKTPPTVFFITDAQGTQESKNTLVLGSRWLWFRPDVVIALAHRRGGSLAFLTRDTGLVECSPDFSVHFGINKLGLVNVYAKDIGQLPDWHQKIWAGYNVSPDGKVSEELLASQMKAKPANTRAPESFLADGLRVLNTHAKNKLGIKLLKEHESIPELLKKTHRFRALDRTGLFSLAKDMARITADSLDVASIQTIVQPPKNIKWGSLKSLEHLISIKVGPEVARSILSRFFGVYELRHGDAHLPSSQINEALTLIGIDQSLPYIYQGYQLLHACVSSIFSIADILSKWDE